MHLISILTMRSPQGRHPGSWPAAPPVNAPPVNAHPVNVQDGGSHAEVRCSGSCTDVGSGGDGSAN